MIHSTLEQGPEELNVLHSEGYSSKSAVEIDSEYLTITHICARDLVVRLKRTPVGFYVAVKSDSEDWTKRTSNKPVSVGKDVIEWDDVIVLPLDRTSEISFTVFASFELGSTLGNGEVIYKSVTTVGDLLNCNGKLEHKDNNKALCPFMDIVMKRGTCGRKEISPNSPDPQDACQLGQLTDKGHDALIRYRDHLEQRDLDESIAFFEQAEYLCHLNHPSRATVLFNLATIKLINCRVNDLPLYLDLPINLLRDVLRLRPRGHPDHPFTLLSLGVALQARFQRKHVSSDATEGESLLSQVLDVSVVDDYVHHAAVLALGTAAKPQLIESAKISQTMENASDHDGKIQRLDTAIRWSFYPDCCKDELIDHLGILLCVRLRYLDDFGDPKKIIPTLGVILPFISDDHPDKRSWLDDLSVSFWVRYERFGDRVDMEKSISLFEDAVRLTPDSDPDKPFRLTILGTSLSTRYKCLGDLTDLERSISLRLEALQSTPDGHPDKPSQLSNLGCSLLARYRRFGDIGDLERSISLTEDALKSMPDGHPEKSIHSNNLANSLSTRYDRFGNMADLEKLISLREDVLQSTPDGHPNKPLLLNNLGDSLSIRYEHSGDVMDLARSISVVEEAVELTPDGHPNKSAWLSTLGHSLLARYNLSGDVLDLDRSISLREDALQHTPDGHRSKPTRLSNLGRSLLTRYEHFGDLADLERSIILIEKALQSISDNHPDKPVWLNSLGTSLLTRYEQFGALVDLEKSISLIEDAVRSTPDDHPDKPSWLNNLAKSLSTRYKRFGGITDLERSICLLNDVVKSTPDGHPNKPLRLNNLNVLFSIRYAHFGDAIDLERSALAMEDVVNLTPDGHPERPMRLSNLGRLVWARYQRFGDTADLKRSTSLFEDVLQSIPDGHPDKPLWLSDLSSSMSARYERFGDTADLDRSVSLMDDALQLTPDGHPEKLVQMNNLSHLLATRFKRFPGDIVDLDKSISLAQDVIQHTPDGHPNKAARLCNLGRSLSTRHKRYGDTADLERSISLCEEAVQLTPNDHPDKPSRLDTLSHSLLTRYKQSGDLADLENSISLRDDAVKYTPKDRPDRLLQLTSLGVSLSIRYERLGDPVDLERSVSVLGDAVNLTPDGHADKPSRLNNLGSSLLVRYLRFGDSVDLERSVSLLEDAVNLTPNGHPDKNHQLNNLGYLLAARYRRFGDTIDLEKSVSLLEDAVQFTPDGHAEKPLRLHNLGGSLSTRYQHFGNIADLEKSISASEQAVQFTPDDHPDKPTRLTGLALSFLQRSVHAGDLSSSDFSRAVSCASCAARSVVGPAIERFRGCQVWIRCIRLLGHDSQALLDASAVAIDLLPRLAWMGLSLYDRYHQLLEAAGGVREAVAAALEVHKPVLAVEWLEQGRSIVWGQLSQLRIPVGDLRTVSPELAAQFERVSHELEHAGARDRALVTEFTSHSDVQDGVLEREARQYHALAVSHEKLVAEIRALPGFEQFLLPKTIEQLSSLTHSGPVIFLNASKHRCDALVVLAGSERVVHVPLSNTNHDEIAGMQLQLNKLLSSKSRVALRDASDRGARLRGITPDEVFRSILLSLWEKVVSPILDVLALSKSDGKLPRIFWCPAGPFSFLPIHAAGIYDSTGPGPKLSDFAISSYIPTMNALELPPQSEEDSELEAPLRSVRLLVVPQPSTDGQAHLSGVCGEIETIKQLASSSPLVGFQEADGTVENVLSKMAETDWVHFACHGTQDRANPYDSGFQLAHGERLKLPDIARLSRADGGLAFLSACHTATGDEQLSEEAIHIAAGMLLAGYEGVIATMWTILDNDAPRVAEDVYKSLFSDGKVPDSRQAAEALHDAVVRLRDSGAPFLSWVPFIHVGL